MAPAEFCRLATDSVGDFLVSIAQGPHLNKTCICCWVSVMNVPTVADGPESLRFCFAHLPFSGRLVFWASAALGVWENFQGGPQLKA